MSQHVVLVAKDAQVISMTKQLLCNFGHMNEKLTFCSFPLVSWVGNNCLCLLIAIAKNPLDDAITIFQNLTCVTKE